jgi:lysophospholipase L1-like esterase
MFRQSAYFLGKVVLLLVAFQHGTLAQSLTVQMNGTNKLSLVAAAPPNVGYRIQASTDLAAWDDMSDQASGTFSYVVDSALAQNHFFRLRTWPTEETPITVVMIGDSTMADFASNLEMFSGWGEGMHDEFKPNVRLVNLATPVQSSKTFLVSIQRQNLELIKPEFVILQFGMADVYPGDVATTVPEYEANLRTILQIIRAFKGTPILVTPTPVRVFENDGRVRTWLPERCAVVRRLSSELQTYLVDLNTLISDVYNELGPTNSAYISWPGDATHFSLAGAEVISDVFVDALPPILASQVSGLTFGALAVRSGLMKGGNVRPLLCGHLLKYDLTP